MFAFFFSVSLSLIPLRMFSFIYYSNNIRNRALIEFRACLFYFIYCRLIHPFSVDWRRTRFSMWFIFCYVFVLIFPHKIYTNIKIKLINLLNVTKPQENEKVHRNAANKKSKQISKNRINVYSNTNVELSNAKYGAQVTRI